MIEEIDFFEKKLEENPVDHFTFDKFFTEFEGLLKPMQTQILSELEESQRLKAEADRTINLMRESGYLSGELEKVLTSLLIVIEKEKKVRDIQTHRFVLGHRLGTQARNIINMANGLQIQASAMENTKQMINEYRKDTKEYNDKMFKLNQMGIVEITKSFKEVISELGSKVGGMQKSVESLSRAIRNMQGFNPVPAEREEKPKTIKEDDEDEEEQEAEF